jgi:hypothetical protein
MFRYISDTLRNRYGLQAWLKWLAGNPTPGATFKPQGYLIPEVGPKALEGKGMKEYEQTMEKLMAAGRGGCPFSSLKA